SCSQDGDCRYQPPKSLWNLSPRTPPARPSARARGLGDRPRHRTAIAARRGGSGRYWTTVQSRVDACARTVHTSVQTVRIARPLRGAHRHTPSGYGPIATPLRTPCRRGVALSFLTRRTTGRAHVRE